MPAASYLIIQTAFIGDVILATALLESLHQKFPEAVLDVVVRKGNEPLLANHPYIRTLYVFDKSRKFMNLFRLIGELRNQHYDRVVNVQRFATTGLMTVLSGGKETIGFDKNPLSFLFSRKVAHQQEGVHEVDRNHRLIEAMVGPSSARPKLYPTNEQYSRVSGYKTQRFITVSPASVWFTKQFGLNKWAEFLRVVPTTYRVYLLGAAGDQALCDQLLAACASDRIVSLAGRLSLLESAALMKDATMNYVNDSAPMHLATAVNAPVTAVYCSTVPSFGFGPLSDVSHVVEVTEKLPCRPCGLHGLRACPLGHFDCSNKIQSDQLLRTMPG